jgi:hypothetical protein
LWITLLNGGQRSMLNHSFEVVPSKIKRFVAVLGGDLPTSKIDRALWQKWVRWLNKKVAKASLARTTARVNYSRAREFVRWLIANGRTAQFPGLDMSSETALS